MNEIETEAHYVDADGKEPYGHVHYADPGYQKDGKKRYPIDTPEHIRAAWNYIHKHHNAGKYTPAQVSSIKRKIVSAWKSKIDPKGPPSSHDAEACRLYEIFLQEEGRIEASEAFGKYKIDGKTMLI